jgi:hypothetical protein
MCPFEDQNEDALMILEPSEPVETSWLNKLIPMKD